MQIQKDVAIQIWLIFKKVFGPVQFDVIFFILLPSSNVCLVARSGGYRSGTVSYIGRYFVILCAIMLFDYFCVLYILCNLGF